MFVIYEYSDAKLIILSFAIIKPAAFFAEIKYAAPQNVWTISKFLQDEATRDIGKTTSYAGKIMSDIIQITSDIIFSTSYVVFPMSGVIFAALVLRKLYGRNSLVC